MFDIHVITILVALVQFQGLAILVAGDPRLFLRIEYTLEIHAVVPPSPRPSRVARRRRPRRPPAARSRALHPESARSQRHLFAQDQARRDGDTDPGIVEHQAASR
jgi:hypothetical protein